MQPAMEGMGQGFEAGPALFGPDMTPSVSVKGAVVKAEPFQACEPLETANTEVKGHVVMIQRGGCSFMKKVCIVRVWVCVVCCVWVLFEVFPMHCSHDHIMVNKCFNSVVPHCLPCLGPECPRRGSQGSACYQ